MSSQQGTKETEITTNNENNQSYNITVKLEVELTHDNINVKTENEVHDETDQAVPFNDMDVQMEGDYRPEHQKQMYARLIKQESELPLTKTHLISNKLINTASTNTNQADNLIESQTRKTVIIELLPMTDGNLSKIGIPEILPTNNTYFNYNETFQFNSITGNIPSLEQEANLLLKTKRKKNIDPRTMFKCPKCPKTYRYMYMLLRHLGVHKSIEKRKMGFLKGVKTRAENRNKKLNKQIKVEVKEEKVKKEGYECTCGNVYRTQNKMETCLRSHQLVADTNLSPCINCTKQFNSKEDVAKHRKKLHGRLFSCKFCQIDYNSGKELFEHLQVHRQVQMTELKFVSEVVEGQGQQLNQFNDEDQNLQCFSRTRGRRLYTEELSCCNRRI
ncbi:hypothetical protein K1T71_013845 [Dendrolimus kikuchii]|uniref:Uncharacterized protein n=1 Tax=Dendrolimus kikuchii TaxID=765133 RepID=A0ACC1CFX0_9NEOP|nr:hypothetical protein K1T71_013845 [Dendrolimus kikuchii]